MSGYQTPNNNNSTNYPGTNVPVTHSFEERLTRIAEFDDALLDQAAWKNSRYAGSKLIAKNINVFTPSSSTIGWAGDESYQNLPVINNLTTALYLANTCIGGEEDDNFVTLKGHSYVGINQILLINLIDDSVQLIDKTTIPFQDFHRFITTDLPTGNSCRVKIIEDQTESVPNTLKGIHRVKMNKGYLLKTFTFKHAGEASGSNAEIIAGNHQDVLTENNTMYLYTSTTASSFVDNLFETGSATSNPPSFTPKEQLRFQYANFSAYEATSSNTNGHKFDMRRFGPKFSSSSIHENKFTQQFYSGSYGIIGGIHSSSGQATTFPADIILSSSWGKASKFISLDCLNFLTVNNGNTSLTEREKTEMHITFFQGTKDFTKGKDLPTSKYDERSIGTFEVDQNRANLMIEQGDVCNGGLPVNHELLFKGPQDNRFMPLTNRFKDDIQTAHLQNASGSGLDGCTTITQSFDTAKTLMSGITIDKKNNIDYYVQGGALGTNGIAGDRTSSAVPQDATDELTFHKRLLTIDRANNDNFYSGSFHYEMSFLDKDHTVILDIDKNAELPNGIGDKGLIIIPQNSHPQVAFNIDFYLEKAGIANTGITTSQNTTTNNNPTLSDLNNK